MAEISLFELVKSLWHHISSRRQNQFYLLLILMLFAAIAETISLGLVLPFLGILADPSLVFNHSFAKPFIIFFGVASSDQIILPVTILFILSVIISLVLRMTLLYFSAKLPYLAANEIGNKIFFNALNRPYAYHLKYNSSEIINAITVKIQFIYSGIIMPLAQLISSSAIIILVVSLLIFFDPIFTISVVLFFSLLYGSLVILAKIKLKQNSTIVALNSTGILKLLQEAFGGIRDVIIDQNQKIYSEKFSYLDLPMKMAQSLNRFIVGSPRFIVESIGMIVIAVIAYWGVFVSSGLQSIILIKLTVLAVVAQRLLPLLQQIYGSFGELIANKHSLFDIIFLLEKPHKELKLTDKKLKYSDSITLENISFKYENTSQLILNKISLEINKGDIIGFVGETGCGKSTLIDIIMGLLKPSDGNLKVDNVVISNENISNWYQHISHVPQDIYLTDGTIKENIAFGQASNKDIDLDRVIESAKAAKINTVIEDLDRGYDTIVGERGSRLSGGQRQRLGIARALYKNSNIIVLDEATSALDVKTEAEVVESIMNLDTKPTILIIAHRLNSLDYCNKIVTFSNNGLIQVKQMTPNKIRTIRC